MLAVLSHGRLNPAHAESCRYAVLCRNPDADWRGKELHKTAFMIGRISPVIPSTETPGRSPVAFGRGEELPVHRAA
jgi:hypothetical protein